MIFEIRNLLFFHCVHDLDSKAIKMQFSYFKEGEVL
jgi:hypothetical protein